MSLTSYRAAPPRVIFVRFWPGSFVRRSLLVFFGQSVEVLIDCIGGGFLRRHLCVF
jgi:hypothetical protein